jgi:hypothetical protein
MEMCLVYLGSDFITDGSLQPAVSESLGQNSKDCILHMNGIQNITITTEKSLRDANGTQTAGIM